jgi:hypothetical protein
MPFDRGVRGLEESWEDSVGLDEHSEEWRSRRDVAWIDGSDFDDVEYVSFQLFCPKGNLETLFVLKLELPPRDFEKVFEIAKQQKPLF